MQARQRSIRRLFNVVLSLVFLALSISLFLFRQQLLDHYTVYKNPPTADIVQAADQAGLNDQGKFMLYASVPMIQPRENFTSSCNNMGEKTAVLGCYSAQRIYILEVTDSRLDGIEQVTLAHEMLHAAYERLSSHDKASVDTLLEQQYAKNTDQRLTDLVTVYDKTEPGERLNELHSIYATEVGSLQPELESYYARYFSDRQKVVGLFNAYYGVFKQIQTQQQSLVDDLNQRARSINAQITSYNQNTSQLQADIDAFNKKADSYTSQATFGRDRDALVTRQSELRQARESIARAITEYDQKKKQLDDVNLQAAQLNQSINSTIDEAPSL